MINKCFLIGRLGKDPEVRYTPDGTAVANFSIATDEVWKDKNGEKVQKTTWHNIVVWKRLAEICAEYLKKGSLVYIEGRIDNSKYNDKDGVVKYKSEIVASTMKMLGGKQDGAGTSEPARNTEVDVPDNYEDVPF